MGDHYRTRLTHTLEVAQIARSAARALGLNEDLAEGLALAHDLGHPPFGHAGEEALNAELSAFGGFDHNVQTLRIVTKLERRYAEFDGLNLTWETLEGMAKHNGPLSGPHSRGVPPPRALLALAVKHGLMPETYAGPEAQVASLADDIAYINHDLDDGVRAGLFKLQDLTEVPLVGPTMARASSDHPNTEGHRLLHETVRRLIDHMLRDMVAETRRRAQEANPTSADEVRNLSTPLVGFSAETTLDFSNLRGFLFEHMYQHPDVTSAAEEGAGVVAGLYRRFVRNPKHLPGDWQPPREVDDAHNARCIADFIAGMTDRFADRQHKALGGEEVLIK